MTAAKIDAPVALVTPDGWRVSGIFPAFRDKLAPLQVPSSFANNPDFVAYRAWRPEGNAVGTVTTQPFAAPAYMAVPYARGGDRGYPNPDDISLECIATGASLAVSSAQTFDEWGVAYRKVPAGFCNGSVRIVATAKAASGASYLGVATPFSVSGMMYYAHAGLGVKGLVVLATWCIFCIIFLAACIAFRAFGIHVEAFGVGALAIGVAGMIVFVFGMLQGRYAETASIVLFAASLSVVAASFVWRRSILIALVDELRWPLFCWLAISMAYVALVVGADNGGGRWAANALFSSLSWSVDNQNPILFAESFVRHASNEPLVAGAWYFDDRTPLLTVMLIIVQTLIVHPLTSWFGTDFAYEGNSVAAITVLSFWMPVLVWLMRKLVLSRPRLFFSIVAISPFVLFNTVYTWGKILGAAYVVLAVGLMLSARRDGNQSRPNLALIPTAFALSYLCHGGNAIGVAAFLLVFAPTLRLRDAKVLLIGIGLSIVVFAPWLYWTHFIQPGGNALARFQLANDIGFDHRSKSVLVSTVEHLRALGWSQWLWGKEQSFRLLVDVFGRMGPFGRPIDTNSPTVLGSQRAIDFIVVSRTIGVASIGVLGIALSYGLPSSRRVDPLALRLAVCGIVGLVMMTLLITQIGVTHHHSYASVLMLAIAGAMYLSEEWPRAGTALYGAWLVYFMAAWVIDPVRNADHIHPPALILGIGWIIALYWAISKYSNEPATQADHRFLWARTA